MALGKTIYLKKLVKSNISLHLEDVEGILNSRWFIMDGKMNRIGVPSNFALSIFVNQSLQVMLNKNLFEVENMEDLLAIAEEKGFIAPSEEERKSYTAPKRTEGMLLAIIKGGQKAKIKKLFESSDKGRALELAIENAKSLPMETIEQIEDLTHVAIIEE